MRRTDETWAEYKVRMQREWHDAARKWLEERERRHWAGNREQVTQH